MEPGPKKLYVVGRLKAVASRKQRRGHAVTVSSGDTLLGSTTTDSAGRFLLEWPDDPSRESFVFRLYNADKSVAESVQLTRADLVSPPFMGFQGDSVLNSNAHQPEAGMNDGFEADGDWPLSVSSSCQQVTLSWTAPAGSVVSITSDGSTIAEGLGAKGTLNVFAPGNKAYTRRARLPGDSGGFSDLTLEVRRHPALSVVLESDHAKGGSELEVGATTSCPAGPQGLLVTMLTSDAAMVPQFDVRIPAGSTWGQAKVRLGTKPGRAKVVATAPGYTRDGVTLILE